MNGNYGFGLKPQDMMNWGYSPMSSGISPMLDINTAVASPVAVANPTLAPVASGGLSGWLRDSGVLNQYGANGQMTGQGWGGLALGVGQGLLSAYMGMKQYGLYKDQLNESKRQFGLNFDAQKRTTNAQLEDRQRARLAANPGAYESVADYMSKYGIQG